MTLLKVKKSRFPFSGRELEKDMQIETSDFPSINSGKWTQLIDLGYFELLDKPGNDLVAAQLQRDRARGVLERTEFIDPDKWTALPGDDARPPDAPQAKKPVDPAPSLQCSACEFTANTPHGLKVHVGRRHKE